MSCMLPLLAVIPLLNYQMLHFVRGCTECLVTGCPIPYLVTLGLGDLFLMLMFKPKRSWFPVKVGTGCS